MNNLKTVSKYYTWVAQGKHGQLKERPTLQKTINWQKPYLLFLDQATHTGYALFDAKGALISSGLFSISGKESVQSYAFALIDQLELMLQTYPIKTIYLEGIYGSQAESQRGSLQTFERLAYIKGRIKDLGYVHNKLDVLEVPSVSWKAALLKPAKVNTTKNTQKAQVQQKILAYYPNLTFITDDESDAIGMGLGVFRSIGVGLNYSITKFNRRLPIYTALFTETWATLKADIEAEKLRAKWKNAYLNGGLTELTYDPKTTDWELEMRKVLTHRDCLVYVLIPATDAHWGKRLLLYNQAPTALQAPDGTYCLLGARKTRL